MRDMKKKLIACLLACLLEKTELSGFFFSKGRVKSPGYKYLTIWERDR